MQIAALSPTPPVGKQDAAKATREFEAMWIQQMLQSARPESEAGEGGSTRDMVLDMADQQIAQLLAAQGGLGLSKLIQDGLKTRDPQPAVTGDASGFGTRGPTLYFHGGGRAKAS
jgi:Rod binding domain-containing protein